MALLGGDYVHEDLFAMAAVYLFHIVCNHPFLDGNKRTGLRAALVFLDFNGVTIAGQTEALYDLTLAVAQGKMGKEGAAGELKRVAGSA